MNDRRAVPLILLTALALVVPAAASGASPASSPPAATAEATPEAGQEGSPADGGAAGGTDLPPSSTPEASPGDPGSSAGPEPTADQTADQTAEPSPGQASPAGSAPQAATPAAEPLAVGPSPGPTPSTPPSEAIHAYWLAHREQLGTALTPEVHGLKNGAVLQGFQRGSVYWVPGSGTFAVRGGIAVYWGAQGWEHGPLGLPTGDEIALRGGASQQFQGGTVYWSPAGGPQTVLGAVRHRWVRAGGHVGSLGYPTSSERPGGDGGVVQSFQGGTITYHDRAGAHVLTGALRTWWLAHGSALGYPTASERTVTGGALQQLERGTAYWSPTTGARGVSGATLRAYASQRWENGPLGFPRTEAARSGRFWTQHFRGGTIVHNTVTGASLITHTSTPPRTPWPAGRPVSYSGTYRAENGAIPGEMCRIPFMPTHWLHCRTIRDTVALNNAYWREFGTNLPIDDWAYSTYRSQADQRIVLATVDAPIVASPGTSPHGWGMAIDFYEGDAYDFGSPIHDWLLRNGPAHGWNLMPWHQATGRYKEYWHWDYVR